MASMETDYCNGSFKKRQAVSFFFLVIGFQRENRVVVTGNWLSFQWRFFGFDVISNKAREIVHDATRPTAVDIVTNGSEVSCP